LVLLIVLLEWFSSDLFARLEFFIPDIKTMEQNYL